MPKRYPFCQYYDECLEKASVHERTLDCRGCDLYEPKEKEYDAHEIAGCFALLVAIVKPRQFERGTIRQWKRKYWPGGDFDLAHRSSILRVEDYSV